MSHTQKFSLRSEQFKPHVGHPSPGDQIRKMIPLNWFGKAAGFTTGRTRGLQETDTLHLKDACTNLLPVTAQGQQNDKHLARFPQHISRPTPGSGSNPTTEAVAPSMPWEKPCLHGALTLSPLAPVNLHQGGRFQHSLGEALACIGLWLKSQPPNPAKEVASDTSQETPQHPLGSTSNSNYPAKMVGPRCPRRTHSSHQIQTQPSHQNHLSHTVCIGMLPHKGMFSRPEEVTVSPNFIEINTEDQTK